MLTENFQYESQFIDTDNIPGGDKRKNVSITNIYITIVLK
jgi:hypothetical protein